jgi:hypothetical protein
MSLLQVWQWPSTAVAGCVGQLAADVAGLGPQPGALRLEGGDEPGPAFPPGSPPLSGGLRHFRWPASSYITNVP